MTNPIIDRRAQETGKKKKKKKKKQATANPPSSSLNLRFSSSPLWTPPPSFLGKKKGVLSLSLLSPLIRHDTSNHGGRKEKERERERDKTRKKIADTIFPFFFFKKKSGGGGNKRETSKKKKRIYPSCCSSTKSTHPSCCMTRRYSWSPRIWGGIDRSYPPFFFLEILLLWQLLFLKSAY